jgi:hypothetical protein
MYNHKRIEMLAAALAACLLAATPMAKAGPDEATLLTQVKQLASQGQDPQTADQVNQYVDENQGVIGAILKEYLNYLKQIQTMTAENYGETPGKPQAAQANGTAGTSQNTAGTMNAASGGMQAGALQPSSGLQASSGLQTSSVQASGGLQTGHLAGYPSLPDVDPTTSVTRLTVEQVDYAAKVQKEMQERKEFLMGQPVADTY